jgi:hypothetical protein
VPRSQLGYFLQSRRQPLELSASPQALDCAELLVRGPACAHEVRMVCVGQTVRAGAGCRHHRTFLEEEHCLTCTGQCEEVGNRLQPLCVGNRVAPAVQHAELDTLLKCDSREELRAFKACTSNL